MKIKNDKGEEIEVFTQAEMDEHTENARAEAAQKAVDEYKAANPDKAQELEQMRNDLKAAQDALEAAEKGDNKGQIARLRQERDDANNKLNTEIGALSKKLDEVMNAGTKELKEDLLVKYSKGNTETRKKIEFEFDNYRPNDTSKKGIEERMAIAVQLVTGSKPTPTVFDNISGGAGDRGNGGNYNANSKEPTANQKAIGKVLGITDEDRKRYDEFKASRAN